MAQRELDFARLTNLADGIFAVAMTFLAFTIQLPAPGSAPGGGLAGKLEGVLPQLGALVVTYLLAARYWALHCDMHRAIVRGSPVLLALNVVFLLAVVLLPFSTDVLGAFPLSGLSVALYAGNIGTLGLLLTVIWDHAVRHPDCLAAPERLRDARIARRVAGAITLLVLASALLAQLRPELGLALLVTIPAGQLWLHSVSRRMEPG